MFENLIELLRAMHEANPDRDLRIIVDHREWRSVVELKDGCLTEASWKPSVGAISHSGQFIVDAESARAAGRKLAE